MSMNLIYRKLFFVIVIFYCANTAVLHMPDRKFWKGVIRLNWVAKWVAA